MKTVLKNAATIATFAYDPFGRRVEKVVGATTTTFTYDVEDILRETAGATTTYYLHGPGIDEPLAKEISGSSTHYHADALGSILKVTNASGSVTHEYRYDAYGRIEAGSAQAGYSFTGREWDPESRLYYYRARYYDHAIGRFISEDPVGLKGGINLYAYVRGNPIRYVDPFGLINFLVGAGATAAAPTGGEVSGGVVVNPGLFRQQADAGVFGAFGGTVGVNVSADVFIGLVKGDISNVSGPTINQNIGIGPLSITVFHDPNTGKVVGSTIGLGPELHRWDTLVRTISLGRSQFGAFSISLDPNLHLLTYANEYGASKLLEDVPKKAGSPCHWVRGD